MRYVLLYKVVIPLSSFQSTPSWIISTQFFLYSSSNDGSENQALLHQLGRSAGRRWSTAPITENFVSTIFNIPAGPLRPSIQPNAGFTSQFQSPVGRFELKANHQQSTRRTQPSKDDVLACSDTYTQGKICVLNTNPANRCREWAFQ